MSWCLKYLCAVGASCMFAYFYYKYLIVVLVFSHLGFWSGDLFLIAPFPDLCLLVPFYFSSNILIVMSIFTGIYVHGVSKKHMSLCKRKRTL